VEDSEWERALSSGRRGAGRHNIIRDLLTYEICKLHHMQVWLMPSSFHSHYQMFRWKLAVGKLAQPNPKRFDWSKRLGKGLKEVCIGSDVARKGGGLRRG
jgi:hypothetical protein